MTDPDQKEIIKQAIKEWMDDQYANIGRWAVRTLLIAAVTSFLFWYITVRGFKIP